MTAHTPHTPQIESLPIAGLIPYARNSRTHSGEQINQIAASIQEYGFTNPVLIDAQGGIIAGHGRVMAAQSLGLEDVPCIRLTHLSDAQKRAYIIADNKLALNAGWDEGILAQEMQDLLDLDYSLDTLGFGSNEIDQLLAGLDDNTEKNPGTPQAPAGIQYQEKFAVLVECQSESDQERIYNQLTGLGLTCKVLVN
jgi:ParB-like chromosome segregation protein Spo0J